MGGQILDVTFIALLITGPFKTIHVNNLIRHLIEHFINS